MAKMKKTAQTVWIVEMSYDGVEWDTIGAAENGTQAAGLLNYTTSIHSYFTGNIMFRVRQVYIWREE